MAHVFFSDQKTGGSIPCIQLVEVLFGKILNPKACECAWITTPDEQVTPPLQPVYECGYEQVNVTRVLKRFEDSVNMKITINPFAIKLLFVFKSTDNIPAKCH